MIDIALNHIQKSFFSKPVFTDVTLELKTGERVGLIGDNGTGKSTLFKIITGEEAPTDGKVMRRNGLKIGYLKQEVNYEDHITVMAVIEEAFLEIKVLQGKIETLSKSLADTTDEDVLQRRLKQLGDLQHHFEQLGGYEVEAKIERVLKGLAINEKMIATPFNRLSGGEQSRVMLAKLLLASPDVMLLDEPTNHLDIETTEWLEQFLKEHTGSVLIISHDRVFLDRVIHKIYELKQGIVETYFGNYTDYLDEREKRYALALNQYQNQQKQIDQLTNAAKRMRDWAGQADNEKMFKRAKAMEKRIERIEKLNKPIQDTNQFDLSFNQSSRAGKVAFEAQGLDLSIGGRSLINNGAFKIISGEHIGLIGNNGTGKTTLIKQIIQRCADIRVNPRLRIGFLEQNVSFEKEGADLIEVYRAYHPGSDGIIRGELAKYGFVQQEVFKQIETLSGGEKMRLMLAILVKQDINCLILDEPTNHIDIKTREILEEAVDQFEGTVLFISHDRYFLESSADRIIEIYNQQLLNYEGDYRFYLQKREKRHEQLLIGNDAEYTVESKIRVKKPSNTAQNSKEPHRVTSMRKKPTKGQKKPPNKVTLEHYERVIEEKEEEIKDVRQAQVTAGNDYVVLQGYDEVLKKLESELETLMASYFELLS